MDLRSLSSELDAGKRCTERRMRVEKELGVDLHLLASTTDVIGTADQSNCEQMFGVVPIPVGYAGPLSVQFSSGKKKDIHLPLATTEGALVASVNRGCKALTDANLTMQSIPHGITRSIAWKAEGSIDKAKTFLEEKKEEWRRIAESTSEHLTITETEITAQDGHVFLTLNADTDEAMGMNMITIAAQAVGEWMESEGEGLTLVTVAANIDSDKKPSLRTYENGRGIEVLATASVSDDVIRSVLKTTPEAMLSVAKAKLELGSEIAGAIGSNLHAANIIAALYLATGQDAAHVVEGSLADTMVERIDGAVKISVRLPAVIVGVRGGGTALPAQRQCLDLLLGESTGLHPKTQLAESIGAAVLAGELSLLAAQAAQQLARAHKTLGRAS